MIFSLPEDDLKHIWDKASCCLSELADSRIFITGGTGFFGHWLLESIGYANEFFDTNIHVVILTRNIKSFIAKSPQFAHLPWLHFLEGDIRLFDFPTADFTHVIHAATDASADLNQNQPLLMLNTIVEGTRRILEFAVHAKAKQFLLTSSGAVYGRQPTTLEKIFETYTGAPDPLNSSSAYAIGKLTAEHLAVLYSQQYQFNVKIARCFAFVGPYLPLKTHFAIGNFIANAINHETIHVAGDGSPYRSYLYASDLTVWLWTILCFGVSGRAYNVGSSQAINIAELADLIANHIHPKLDVMIAKQRDPHVLSERYVPDTQRAQQELKLKQWVDLPTAINRTILWSQSHAKIKSLCC